MEKIIICCILAPDLLSVSITKIKHNKNTCIKVTEYISDVNKIAFPDQQTPHNVNNKQLFVITLMVSQAPFISRMCISFIDT